MSSAGLHWHDAALALARSGELVLVESSLSMADPARPVLLGQPAAHVARLSPHLVSAEHWASIARAADRAPSAALAVARAELSRLVPADIRALPLQCAVSTAFDASLGTLLAVARLEGIVIGGFHDAASLVVAATGLRTSTLVLEIGLAHVAATRVECIDGVARRRAAVVKRDIGRLALQQSWLRMIGEAMVLKSRFDPLHDATSEQQLYERLDAAAASAARTGSCVIELPRGGEIARVELARDSFAESGAALYEVVLAALHELRPAGQRVNVLFDEALLDLPGFVERLAELRGCRLLTHSTGLAARAASLLDARVDGDGAVAVLRGHALRDALEAPREPDLSSRPTSTEVPPTHALWEGRAVALPLAGALEIGREPGAGGIRLADGLTGVSRLHCSLRVETGDVTLVPHTEQGTWLNEERVRSRVRVLSGDRLRLGTPGVVIELIAVGGMRDGTAQR